MCVLKFESEPHETKGTNNMRMQQQKRERNVNKNAKLCIGEMAYDVSSKKGSTTFITLTTWSRKLNKPQRFPAARTCMESFVARKIAMPNANLLQLKLAIYDK